MAAPNDITVTELNCLIGTPGCPDVVDICIDPDFEADPYLIPGSRKHPHTDIPGLMASLTPGRRVVVVCQKGLKLSQGVAAWLASEGIAAQHLGGGMFAWRDTPQTMRVPFAALPTPIHGQTLWVTRHRPGTDRLACAWLIRRFVDPRAKVLFVAPSEVAGVADRLGATAFAAEEAPKDRAAFDTLLDQFQLTAPALVRLAEVVRGAAAHRPDAPSVAAGLLALTSGLSHQFHNDYDRLQAGMTLYDALYHWARDGYDEYHDWPTARKSA